MSDFLVRDNPARSRYELLDDGVVVGFTDYYPRGDALVFPHTVTHEARRGAGLATKLIEAALDDVRKQGLHIIPECWFVRDFLDEHPEYADLVAPGA